MNYLHYSQAGYGWSENGGGESHREPIYAPDIAEIIDGPDPDDSLISDEDAMTAMAKIMNEVLRFCFENSKNGDPDLSRAFRRFACITWAIRPELFSHASLAALSPHLHVTRAALSAIVRRFCDQYGVRNVLMKNETTRETYSKARKASHARRLKEKPGTPCEAPGSDDQIGLNPHTEVSQ
jgi:hypothetical protein